MGKLKFIACVVAMALMAVATTSCFPDEAAGDSYIAFRSTPTGKWGMINATTGEVLFEEEFDAACHLSMGSHGVFWVENARGEFHLYTCDKEPQQLAGPFSQVADFFDDVAPVVKKDSVITVIGTNGTERFKLEKVNDVPVTKCSNFSHGVAAVQCGATAALIDSDGKVLVEPGRYARIVVGLDSLVMALPTVDSVTTGVGGNMKGRGSVDVLDLTGRRVGGFELGNYGEVASTYFHGRLAAADKKGRWGFLGRNGAWTMQPAEQVKGVTMPGPMSSDNERFVFLNSAGNCGLMDYRGKVLMQPTYNYVALHGNYFAAAQNENGTWQLRHFDGRAMGNDSYRSLFFVEDGTIAFAQTGENSWKALDENGKDLTINNADGKAVTIAAVSAPMLHREVTSERVDLDGIVEALRLMADGMMGMNMDMAPREVAPVLKAADTRTVVLIDSVSFSQGDAEAPRWADEHNPRIMSAPCRLATAQGVARAQYRQAPITAIIGVANEPITDMQGNTVYHSHETTLGYQFTDSIAPETLSVTIEGNEVLAGDKLTRLVDKLKNKVAPFGEVLASNDNAAVVASGTTCTYLIYREEEKVTVMLLRGGSTPDEARDFVNLHATP